MRWLFPIVLCLLWAPAAVAAEGLRIDRQSAVILVYNRVGEDAFPSANIRTDQFDAHMRYLHDEGFTVLPLPQIVTALRTGKDLPDKTVAITFDGAHRSVRDNAVPILKAHKFPYTIFAPSFYADSKDGDYLSWSDLKKLRDDDRATIGLQSAFYTHLNEIKDDDLKRGINTARKHYRDAMGAEPALYAYPFGETSTAYRNAIEAQGFQAAFGQQSGASSPASDIFSLPRFSMTESYGDLERFKTAVTALPLPITGLEPADPYLKNSNPAIGFTLPAALAARDDFECFASDAPGLDLQRLGEGRIELRFAEPLYTERVRINCTVTQGTDDPENPYRWRWFGMLFTLKGISEVTTEQAE